MLTFTRNRSNAPRRRGTRPLAGKPRSDGHDRPTPTPVYRHGTRAPSQTFPHTTTTLRALAAAIVLGLAACSATNPPGHLRTWGDVDAAVRKACSERELAILETRRVNDTERIYRLVSVRDEPGEIRVEIQPASGALRLEHVSASVGRLGSPALERDIERAVREWEPAHAR